MNTNKGKIKFFKGILFSLLSLSAKQANAGCKFKFYFNHAVDNTVSTGTNAINLNGYIDDTLIAYINRSKYTLDIAVYDFLSGSGTSSLANVATAINAAYTRGVKVRWIFNGSCSNTGLSLLNSGIDTLGSPTTSSYTIMHNKFMIVDGNSPNPDESVVWTGSTNWSTTQFNTDYDNVVIIQDSALAHAYIGEFNMMWGDTGIAPNRANSKFGHTKSDLGRHNFTIDGKHVELYFSPSDNTGSHISSTIATANTDLYWGMYTFTYQSYATDIVAKKTSGVYVAGIDDSYSHSYTPYNTFTTGLGSMFKEYTGTGLYHNKYMIVDPSDSCSDPIVLTGSHNWSNSANTDNDENTLIIHDATAANIYYQSFKADFTSMGGILTHVNGCTTAVPKVSATISGLAIAPNPAQGNFFLSCNINQPQVLTVTLISMDGKTSTTIMDEWQGSGYFKRYFKVPVPGIYIVKVVSGTDSYNLRLITN